MPPKKPSLLRSLLTVHRYIGLSVAIIAIFLAITGIMLNHTNQIGIDKNFVHSPTILKWYGIQPPVKVTGFQIEQHWLSRWNDDIYFNDQRIAQSSSPLRGAIKTNHFYALSTAEEIWLLTVDGEIIEKLSAPAEKLGDILALGHQDKHTVIKTEQGISRADSDLIAWHPITDTRISWSQAAPLPIPLSEKIFTKGHSISWERVLLDMHSGRIVTAGGTLLIDLAGIMLIVLALSGCIIWLKRRKRLNNRIHK